jgi:hypothetical protein
MATAIDESQEALREERVYAPLTDTERSRQLRPSLSPRYEEVVVLSLGPRVRWGGIVAGVVAAFAVSLLCTVLGIALGFSPPDIPILALNTEILRPPRWWGHPSWNADLGPIECNIFVACDRWRCARAWKTARRNAA